MRLLHGFACGGFFALATVDAVARYGLASRETVDDRRLVLDQWRDAPGAKAGVAGGAARKP